MTRNTVYTAVPDLTAASGYCRLCEDARPDWTDGAYRYHRSCITFAANRGDISDRAASNLLKYGEPVR